MRSISVEIHKLVNADSVFFVQCSISKSDPQKWNVLRSASFERTMQSPLTIPKTNKTTFHVSSKKNPNPLQSYRSTHETNSKLKSSTDVTGAHRRSRSDWLNFCNSVRIYILSWCEGSDSLISHQRGSVTFCDKPDVPKIETFQLAERPKSATCDTLATTKSIPFRASIGIRGFSVKDAINQMLVMNIIISVLSSWLPCCWRLGVNAILAEVVFLLLIIILLSWRFAIFLVDFLPSGRLLYLSRCTTWRLVSKCGERTRKRSVLLHVDLLFFAFPLV